MARILSLVLLVFLLISPSYAKSDSTLFALQELQNSKQILQKEVETQSKALKAATSDDEKQQFKESINKLNQQVDAIETKFERIATGIDISTVKPEEVISNTTLSEDFQMLLKPLIASAKGATKEMRQKSELQEEIEHYKRILPSAVKAYENIQTLLKDANSTDLKGELKPLEKYWLQQIQLLSSNLNASLHQLDTLEQNSVSFVDAFQTNTKSFFEERGLFLFEGLVAFILVIVLMQLFHMWIVKIFPIFTKPNRSFFLRLIDLFYRILMVIMAIVVPMAIFYVEEDWFLFSIGILVLFGLAWTFRHIISKLWQQALLLLNVGSVREDERIFYEGLPWRVRNINIFTVLENPISKVRLRIPIESLIGLTSRPAGKNEPWFPCRIGDWMMLTDGYYGVVTGISLEFIEFQDLGGGQRTYLVSSFLQLSPTNVSTDFRIVQTFGISYQHQRESTTTVIQQLEAFIRNKIQQEEYDTHLKLLLVQFDSAEDSSLNVAVIANFDGELAPFYFKLKRSISRWCVDACNAYGWEIPFPQLTIHQPTIKES
ncbi:MAG TPA: mechanosensitive ion channel [Campylobacterales bacterium]|nr:mechanosensitive ion channel [Campylobacterales bacterium]